MKVFILVLFLSGCSSLTQVEMSVKCKEMRGKIGNSCTIQAPNNSNIFINGETIEIEYTGAE